MTFPGLQSLDIEDFRNIESARLRFSNGLNLITGPNAAGKTSLLEAIYCLGRVHSFRTADNNSLVRQGQGGWRLIGRIGKSAGHTFPVGVERSAGSYEIRLNGQPVRRLSELAGCLAVHLMANDNANILTGGPRFRRQSLDWALFHVERGYREVWQRFARGLRQRNAVLRAQGTVSQVAAWNGELVEAALILDRMRRTYLGELEPLLTEELQQLVPGIRITLSYRAGWTQGETLSTVLDTTLDRDLARGFTHAGPQRADFSVRVDGVPVQTRFSRGQQKVTVLAWLLAQAKYLQAHEGPPSVFLLDDVTSELDVAHQDRLVSALDGLQSQVFATAIEPRTFRVSSWPIVKRFHVEHGEIQEVV